MQNLRVISLWMLQLISSMAVQRSFKIYMLYIVRKNSPESTWRRQSKADVTCKAITLHEMDFNKHVFWAFSIFFIYFLSNISLTLANVCMRMDINICYSSLLRALINQAFWANSILDLYKTSIMKENLGSRFYVTLQRAVKGDI